MNPSMAMKLFGMDGRRKVSVISIMSIFKTFRSWAINAQAFWFVLFNFFRENTFKRAITGSVPLCFEDFSHNAGGGTSPQFVDWMSLIFCILFKGQ